MRLSVQYERSWTDDELKEAVAKSSCISHVTGKLGLVTAGVNFRRISKRIIELGLDTTHFSQRQPKMQETIPDDQVLVFGAEVRGAVVRRVLKKYLPYRCRDCPNAGEWNGRALTLQVEHIDGDHKNNRLENLCWLCPNCHTQTPTWGGRSAGRWKDGRKIDRRFGEQGLKEDRPHLWRVDHKQVYDEFCKTNNYLGTGRLFGISDNAVRKIVRRRNRKNEAIV